MTNKTEKKLGKFQIVNGTVVATAPDESETLENLETSEEEETNEVPEILVAETSNGSVTINSEDVREEDLQYVFDEKTETISNKLAAKVRQENQARAAKASTKTTIIKSKSSVVANPESYDDIDLDFLDSLNSLDTLKK